VIALMRATDVGVGVKSAAGVQACRQTRQQAVSDWRHQSRAANNRCPSQQTTALSHCPQVDSVPIHFWLFCNSLQCMFALIKPTVQHVHHVRCEDIYERIRFSVQLW